MPREDGLAEWVAFAEGHRLPPGGMGGEVDASDTAEE